MPKIAYIEKRFNAASRAVISEANVIIEEYQGKGFTLTVRQLYYQFVARGHLPNTHRNYIRLASIINEARLAGLVDWEAIEDRTRNLRSRPSWSSPSSIVRACADQFHVARWDDQDHAPEVWIEKDALVGVIEGVCGELDVPYFACRGYTSQSEQWRAGLRFARARTQGRSPVVFHLGDHDPSGIDMTRDNRDRLALFARHGVRVERLALNMDQVEHYGPPPNPAKSTDSRFEAYVEEHGDESWELDALDPEVISNLVRTAVTELIDQERWAAAEAREEAGRARLSEVARDLEAE